MVYRDYVRTSKTKDLGSRGQSPNYYVAIPAYRKISISSQTPSIGALVCVGLKSAFLLGTKRDSKRLGYTV